MVSFFLPVAFLNKFLQIILHKKRPQETEVEHCPLVVESHKSAVKVECLSATVVAVHVDGGDGGGGSGWVVVVACAGSSKVAAEEEQWCYIPESMEMAVTAAAESSMGSSYCSLERWYEMHFALISPN
ncbi:hypothetical protein NL676_025846 [Syzygium grande]|nr:hypothetical protein NL676_025846 [Syzygium grande]